MPLVGDNMQLEANGTIAPFRFIKLDTTGDNLCLQATDGAGAHGDEAVGVTRPAQKRPPGLAGSDVTIAYEAGDPVGFFPLGTVCDLEIGAAVTRGDDLKPDANGRGITASVTGDKVAAVALQSGGGSGVRIKARLVRYDHA